MEKCLKCGKLLEAPSGAGRPPRYCSVGCRRTAEHEIRRLGRHIEKLETERLSLAGRCPLATCDIRGRTFDEAREDIDRAIAELEARLALLLAANE